jgi:hypothetical protein
MKLTTRQAYERLLKHGCYVTEACDKCGQLLGPVRFTRYGESGVWCSRECRDGAEAHTPGTCKGCGTSLAGLRRGTKFCSDVCRVRENRKSQPGQISRNTPRKTKALTGAGIGFGYPYTKGGQKQPIDENGGARF